MRERIMVVVTYDAASPQVRPGRPLPPENQLKAGTAIGLNVIEGGAQPPFDDCAMPPRGGRRYP